MEELAVEMQIQVPTHAKQDADWNTSLWPSLNLFASLLDYLEIYI